MILGLLLLNCWLYSVGDKRTSLDGIYWLFDDWAKTQMGGGSCEG